MIEDDETPWHRMVRERKKRQTIEGKIELAEAGDTDAARSLLALFAYQVRLTREHWPEHELQSKGYVSPRLMEYVAGICRDALAIRPSDAPKALGLAPGESGRPPRTARENEDYVCMGIDVDRARGSTRNLDEACQTVAADWNASPRQARRAYQDVVVAIRKRGTNNL